MAAKDLQNTQNKNLPAAGICSSLNNAVGANTGSSLTITKAVPSIVKSKEFEIDVGSTSRPSSLEISRVPRSTNGTCNVPLASTDGTPRVILPSTNGKLQINPQGCMDNRITDMMFALFLMKMIFIKCEKLFLVNKVLPMLMIIFVINETNY